MTASGVSYPVEPDTARAHLMILASGGTMDLAPTFGDQAVDGDPDWSEILFAPSPAPGTGSASDRVRSRLLALVTDTSVYQVVGVSGATIWSDGSTVAAQPAFALGNTVFYDTSNCNGDGRWIWGTNGDKECTNSVGMLHHELAHAFRNHGAGSLLEEEGEAIDDENDLRNALAQVPRDRARIQGGCGCPVDDCCIVASVALGSPYAPGVNQLRRIRDFRLRATRLGSAFFDRLHSEYYAFSVDVCRVMVTSAQARRDVEQWLVRPLSDALWLLRDALDQRQATQAGWERRLRDAPALPEPLGMLPQMLRTVMRGVVPATEVDPGTREVLALLAQWLPRSPFVVWGLIEPLSIWSAAVASLRSGVDAAEVADTIRQQARQWLEDWPGAALMPVIGAERWCEAVDELAASMVGDAELRAAIVPVWRAQGVSS